MGSRSSLTTTPSMSTSNDISDNVCADETPVGYGARGWETRSGVVGFILLARNQFDPHKTPNMN